MFLCFRKPNGDYRSSPISKDRSRSPMGSVVVPSGLGVHSNHLYSHAHHHHHHHHHLVGLVGMDQPLALTKNSTVESARTSTAIMATVPHAVGVAERQQVSSTGFWAHLTIAARALRPWTFLFLQNRPSVITCAPANNRNCNLSHCPVSHTGCSSLRNNYRRMNSEHAQTQQTE